MTKLPDDIDRRIDFLFGHEAERARARDLLQALWAENLNVGPAQLARCILVLAENNLEQLEVLATTYMGDPRDVIMNAEAKAGFPGHYFGNPFEE